MNLVKGYKFCILKKIRLEKMYFVSVWFSSFFHFCCFYANSLFTATALSPQNCSKTAQRHYVSKSWVIFVKRTPFFALGLYEYIQWWNDRAVDRAQLGTGSGGLKKGLEGPKMTQKMKNRSFSLKEAYFYTKVGKCSSD